MLDKFIFCVRFERLHLTSILIKSQCLIFHMNVTALSVKNKQIKGPNVWACPLGSTYVFLVADSESELSFC